MHPTTRLALTSLALVLGLATPAAAQYPTCPGTADAEAAAAFERGNALMTQAIDQARHRHADQAHALAEQARAQFEIQCAHGDSGALREIAGAYLLAGDRAHAGQVYDAYLASHPLESLEMRVRRSVEQNLEAGRLAVSFSGDAAELFVDGLDYGPLPRSRELRIAAGDHSVEAHAQDGRVLDSRTVTVPTDAVATASLGAPTGPVRIVEHHEPDASATTTAEETTPTPVAVRTTTPADPAPDAPAHDDSSSMMPWAITAAAATGAFLVAGIVLHVVAENRAQTYRAAPCNGSPTPLSDSCGSVLSEYNTTFPAAIAFDVLTGVAAVTSVVLFAVELSRPHDRTHADLACGVTGTGVSCHGSW